MFEIEHILERLKKVLNEIDLKYVIVGGVAAIIRGKPRTTMDVDIILENKRKTISKFLDLLKENNFDVLDNQVKLAFDEGMNASIFDKESTMRLDVKIALSEFDRDALQNFNQVIYSNISINVVSVNHILVGKIMFLGDISDISESELLEYNDVRDFVNVFVHNKEKVNITLLKEKSMEMGLSKTLARLINFINKEF